MHDYIVRAIRSLRPDSEFSFVNDDYSTIEWIVLEGTAPTKKQIDDEIVRLKTQDEAAAAAQAVSKASVLSKLGITEEELKAAVS